jgi:hypothetical protein
LFFTQDWRWAGPRRFTVVRLAFFSFACL